jgi:hypothetical protein
VWAGVEAEAEEQEQQGRGAGGRGGGGGGAAAGAAVGPAVDFRAVLARVPERNAAGRLEDLSVHMAFICLLHLANERGLAVKGAPDLRTLSVHQPQPQQQQR